MVVCPLQHNAADLPPPPLCYKTFLLTHSPMKLFATYCKGVQFFLFLVITYKSDGRLKNRQVGGYFLVFFSLGFQGKKKTQTKIYAKQSSKDQITTQFLNKAGQKMKKHKKMCSVFFFTRGKKKNRKMSFCGGRQEIICYNKKK